MACNCKVNEHINKLNKRYGYEVNTSWKENTNFKGIELVKLLLLTVLCIFLLPIILTIVLVLCLFGIRSFNVNKILSLLIRRNKRNE